MAANLADDTPNVTSSRIIKDGQITEDQWHLINNADEILPSGDIIVPLALWQQSAEALLQRDGRLGIWLDSDQGPEDIAADLEHFALIAINFPAFTDGRGYSSARLLRERYHYCGEIRAIGDVLQDQLFYMQRCGFSSFAIKAGKDIDAALAGLNVFSVRYQAAVDDPTPLYRRRTS